MLRRIPFYQTLIALGVLTATVASAQDLNGLLQRSPFGATSPGQTAAAEGPLELRSVMIDQGEYFFSVYQPSSQTALWVGLNEAGNLFTVRTYDDKTETVTVEFQGRTLALSLKQAKIHAFVQRAPVSPQAAVQPQGVSPNIAPANAADEANRMARVAEEVRRRRALRQQPVPTPGSPLPPGQMPNQPPNQFQNQRPNQPQNPNRTGNQTP